MLQLIVPWDKSQGISIKFDLVFSIDKILNAVYSSIRSKGGAKSAEGSKFYNRF